METMFSIVLVQQTVTVVVAVCNWERKEKLEEKVCRSRV